MSKTHRGIKYRIYPTSKQQILINETFGHSRFVYNTMLSLSKNAYTKGEKFVSRNKFNYRLTTLKKEFPWLSEVDATALTSANDALAEAFSNFFAKRAGFPNFRKKQMRESYTSKKIQGSNNIGLNGKHVKLPKLGAAQICHACGGLHPEMKDLTIRTMKCDCGLTMNRDQNAAINILNEGLRVLVKSA